MYKNMKKEQLISLLKALNVREVNGEYTRVKKTSISDPESAVNAALSVVLDFQKENAIVLCLDVQKQLIDKKLISVGTASRTLINPKEIFRHAVAENADSIIFLHNHPSGNVIPSKDDYAVTERLLKSGTILGVTLLDSVVFNADGCFKSLMTS